MTLPHALPNGGEFRGYKLPAGTMVVVDLRSIHMQPDLWENPDCFHPPRFIQDDGSVNRKLPLVAFGMGEDYDKDDHQYSYPATFACTDDEDDDDDDDDDDDNIL